MGGGGAEVVGVGGSVLNRESEVSKGPHFGVSPPQLSHIYIPKQSSCASVSLLLCPVDATTCAKSDRV